MTATNRSRRVNRLQTTVRLIDSVFRVPFAAQITNKISRSINVQSGLVRFILFVDFGSGYLVYQLYRFLVERER